MEDGELEGLGLGLLDDGLGVGLLDDGVGVGLADGLMDDGAGVVLAGDGVGVALAGAEEAALGLVGLVVTAVSWAAHGFVAVGAALAGPASNTPARLAGMMTNPEIAPSA